MKCYITHSKEFAGNQGKCQNFGPSILPYKFGLIFMRVKQKKFKMAVFQNGRFSKWPFFKIANSQKFLCKFHGLVLELVGLIDAKGIGVAQPIWS